jgi:glycosyltransferase involved in cell wall biosynthesis
MSRAPGGGTGDDGRLRAPCRFSVVVPMHNEEGNAEALAVKLLGAMDALGEKYELIFVDDGSTDGTFGVLAGLAQESSEICVVKLKQNFGQTAALSAGFDHAAGEIILAMDGDLRSDPNDIPKLLAKLEEGFDVANGWRHEREHEGFLRTFPSRVANRWLASLSGVRINDFGTTFKAYRREVIEGMRLYGEQHRYLPVLASWQGARIGEVPVSDSPRRFGKSHYGIGRLFRVPFDMMTLKFLRHYRAAPMHLFGPLGMVSILAGAVDWLALGALWAVRGQSPASHAVAAILGGVLLVAGLQSLAMGFFGELITHVHLGPRREPNYYVEEILGGARNEEAETEPRANAARSGG